VPTEWKKPTEDGMTLAKTKDNEGREYHKVFYHTTINACIALGQQNIIIPVRINIGLRRGNSHFNEEVVFQLIQDGDIKKQPYNKTSPENHIEFYLPKEDGINLFKNCLIQFHAADGKLPIFD